MRILLLLVMVCFLGCAKEGKPINDIQQPGNDDFNVVFLFQTDNIKIYRFNDAGHYRYFATGAGAFLPQTQLRYTSNGKSSFIESWDDGAITCP